MATDEKKAKAEVYLRRKDLLQPFVYDPRKKWTKEEAMWRAAAFYVPLGLHDRR